MISNENWEFTTKTLKELMKQSDRLKKTLTGLMIAPTSPLIHPQAIIEGRLVDALSKLIDDQYGYLSWYVYTCDYGRRPMKAGYAEAIQLIDSFDKLRWLIEIGQNH